MSFLRDESGFSLTELLTAMVIGSIVLWALMTLMTTGLVKSLEVSDRADAAQTGRSAMDRMTTLIDSSICLDPISNVLAVPPLVGAQAASPPTVPVAEAGSDSSKFGFYADLSGVSDQPDKYTLTYDAAARTITESRFDSSGTLPNISIPASPTRTVVLATNVVQARTDAGAQLPIFRYYRYETNGTINGSAPMTTPVVQDEANEAVRVVIAFKAISKRTNKEDARATTIEGQASIGTPDPANPNAGACP